MSAVDVLISFESHLFILQYKINFNVFSFICVDSVSSNVVFKRFCCRDFYKSWLKKLQLLVGNYKNKINQASQNIVHIIYHRELISIRLQKN